MEIRVLGDLTIDGGRLSPKERSLLAALVLRAGNVVTPPELADAVWGDELPSTWPKQVQAFVVQIRRALGSTSIATTRGGYRLRIDPDSIDAVRYERLIEIAGVHRANGDPVRAIDVLERAASLWSGAPYSDLGEWPAAIAEAERLEEIRKSAEEDLQAARLEGGEHRAVVPDAERLVKADPLRERRWAILVTALYRSGRQADALATLRSARERLADELGIEPGAELVALESAILHQDASLDAPLRPELTSADCPYRGLQPFGTDDAEEFFGRDADVQAALARLSGLPFLAISGASGAGKSSLVLAGIVPALRARGDLVVVLGSGATPIARLRDALSGRGNADVVVIDQFEELFHSGLPDAHVAEFSALIADAVAVGQRVIVAVRADFLSSCAAEPSIGPLFAAGVHLVGPLGPDGLRSAIEEPARLAGLRLEPGLVELILRDAAGAPGVLPHVSHALVETWLRREGATLTVAGYEDSGGISGAIAKSADQLYLSLDPDARATCRATFLRLVEISADGAPMRRRIPITPMRQDAAHDRVLTSLARARLVSADEDSLIVAHESLATAWPRLRGWLEDDTEGVRAMSALASAVSTWEADGRPDEDLYRGARLNAVLAWRDAADPELTESEVDFLEASAEQERAAIDEIEHRAKHDRRQNRRLRVLLAAAVTLFAVAVTAGGFVAAGSTETAHQRETAQIEALTSTALSLRGTDRDVAALLAAEAHRRWPDDPRTRSALMGAMTSSHGLLATTHLEGVDGMSGTLIPGTRRAVAVTADGSAVYDIDSGALVHPVDLPKESPDTDSRYGPAVSGNGARVANADRILDDTDTQVGIRLSVADLATGALIRPTIELDFPLSSITMNHGGDLIAAIDQIGTLRLIDADTGLIRQVTGTSVHDAQDATDRAGAVRFIPNGRLVYGTVEGPLQVVDPDAAAVVATVPMPAESTNVSMTVVSDTRVITAGDQWISSIDIAAGRVDWSQQLLTTTDDPCPWVTASVELRTVYCGDLFGHIDERSLDTGAPTERSFDPQLGFVGTMSVVEDRQELVVVGRGTAITRWKLDGSGAVTRVLAPGWVIRDRYSPAGSSLVVARRADGVEWWGDYREFAVLDTRTEELLLRVPTPSFGVMWAGESTLVGDFGGVGPRRTGYLDIRTGESYSGDPLPEHVESVWMNARGDRMHVGRPGGEIWTIDPTTGRRTEPTMQTDGGYPVLISTSPDGSRVLVTSWNKEYTPDSILFDGATGERIRKGLVGIGRTALTARDEIATIFRLQSVVRYDADTFEQIGALPGASGGLDTLNVSADGRILSTYSLDNTVTLYDLVGGVQLGDPIPVFGEWNYEMGGVYSGVLRADGTELAVNVPAGIAVWDLRPSSQADAACRMAGRDLTRDEWIAYLSDLGPYRSTCGFGGE
ncbi:nSTAND1 domain-containing NTPase [Agromyces albus]|uniref:nSTAND1 domain-containing NTPase n=1 Tax=Agromyces albus TaxID=205332 RepID=UPI002787C82E|nr:BTAD domain-containing putative transcriptional regulator [Agromyces albus]MDQ0575801.1 DNA-binding SARP family transcriptional activator/WD40 repeat protein [Agromyces albus]